MKNSEKVGNSEFFVKSLRSRNIPCHLQKVCKIEKFRLTGKIPAKLGNSVLLATPLRNLCLQKGESAAAGLDSADNCRRVRRETTLDAIIAPASGLLRAILAVEGKIEINKV